MSIARRLAIAATVPATVRAGTFTTLYNFTGNADGRYPEGQLVYDAGALYGMTPGFLDNNDTDKGNMFKLDVATGALTILHAFKGGNDGSGPNEVIYHGGKLYGTTYYGGPADYGTVFVINAETGAEKVLYSFTQHVSRLRVMIDLVDGRLRVDATLTKATRLQRVQRQR